MKSNFVITIILIGVLVFVAYWVITKIIPGSNVAQSGVPIVQNTSSKPLPTSTPTPPQYHFDSSTNLKDELNSVNPEVLDSDFGTIKKTVSSL